MTPIQGIHHITAVASDPNSNRDFYHHILGQRLVKTTVNFDDPGTYHLYYGDETGTPGTIITFFPWRGMHRGSVGVGEAAVVGYAIPSTSTEFWKARLDSMSIPVRVLESFGEARLRIEDPDGMAIDLVATDHALPATHWEAGPVPAAHAIRGFHSIVLRVVDTAGGTAGVLTGAMGFERSAADGTVTRYVASGDAGASIVDVEEHPSSARGRFGAGSIHHVAFRTRDDAEQLEYQKLLHDAGLGVTEVKDRQYFRSIYFREPGGVLFEVATDAPGFLYDEPVAELGSTLKLPTWLESRREEIANRLPLLHRTDYQQFVQSVRPSESATKA